MTRHCGFMQLDCNNWAICPTGSVIPFHLRRTQGISRMLCIVFPETKLVLFLVGPRTCTAFVVKRCPHKSWWSLRAFWVIMLMRLISNSIFVTLSSKSFFDHLVFVAGQWIMMLTDVLCHLLTWSEDGSHSKAFQIYIYICSTYFGH